MSAENKEKMQKVYKDLQYQLVNKNQYLVYNYNSYSLVTELGTVMLPPSNVLYHGRLISFHSPSEHMLEGKRFDMELHLLYQIVDKADLGRHDREDLEREKQNDMGQEWKAPLDVKPNLVVVLLFSLSDDDNLFLDSL